MKFRAWMCSHGLETVPGAVAFLIFMSVTSVSSLLLLAWLCAQVWGRLFHSIIGCAA